MSGPGCGSLSGMPLVTAHVSISLDGFIAGPDQSLEQPLGRRGHELHFWHMPGGSDHEVDRAMAERILAPRGAYVMGRNMYGPVRGAWESWSDGEMWQGWWGEEPPYHAPVFVLTHHPHAPVELQGTTFHFVTSFDEAMERALEAAGDDTVTIAGGASAVRQGLAAGVVDQIMLNHAPVVLGGGESIFTDLPDLRLRPVEVHASPYATHVVYDVVR
jgi:dihydrofolate reductase